MSLSIAEFKVIQDAYVRAAKRIADAGYSIRVLDDFEAVKTEIEAAQKPLTPFFWESYNDFNGHDAFCLVLEQGGKGLAYICTLLIECGKRNFHQTYTARLNRVYSHDPKARLDPNWVCDPMLEINGLVAYSGDAVRHPEFTGKDTLKAFGWLSAASLFFTVCYNKDVSWVVGTVRERDYRRGLGQVYGATRVDPMAEKWLNLPDEREANYAFCSSSRSDILYRAKCAIHQSVQPEPTGYNLASLNQSRRFENA